MSDLPSKTPEFQKRLADIRRTDNHTNFRFILRAWLILALAIGGFIAFDLYRSAAGWSLTWDLPFYLLVVIIVGASQHQLAGAGHEATHYILFKNRRLSEFVSDWFCMFPILTSTSVYRGQHLAHHQHVNDPGRDPDLAQLHSSGHDFEFPMKPRAFFRSLLRQLWPSNLLRYLFHRAHYSAVGASKGTSLPNLLFFPYMLLLFGILGLLAHLEMPPWTYPAATVLIALPLASLFWLRPEKTDPARSESPFSARTLTFCRYSHITAILLGLTMIHVYTGLESLTYFALLWCVPLLTTFSFFMMLRQIIQHGNCDEGKFTNTRVFFVNPLLRYAVFPFGMDYHLPHHLYATVPHYRLPELHKLLLQEPGYQSRGGVVSGCFRSTGTADPRSPQAPSVVDVLGPEFAPIRHPESSQNNDGKEAKEGGAPSEVVAESAHD